MGVQIAFMLLFLDHFREKIQSAVRVTREGCWEWTRGTDGRYGHVYIAGVRFKAHTAAYLLWVGRIPRGYVLRHQCDNPACCNPFHVLPGTQKQNRWEASERGRCANGLTASQVRRIRILITKGHGDAAVAGRIGCHSTSVWRIRNGHMR